MIDDGLHRQILGQLSIPGGVAVIGTSMGRRRPLYPQEFRAVREMRRDMQEDLPRRHEYAHYRQLMTTPFGFLLWRSFKTLLGGVEALAAVVSSMDPAPRWRAPIHRWILEEEANLAPDDPRRPMLPLCRQTEVLLEFIAALLGKPEGLTVGAFLRTCEAAYASICQSSDLPYAVSFESRRDDSAPMYEPEMLSGTEILEAGARFEERFALEALPDSLADIDNWEAKSIFNVYERGYRWLLDEMGEAMAALALIDTALMTPFDPAFLHPQARVVYVEDLIPSLRLPRLAAEAKRHLWFRDVREMDALLGGDLCVGAGLEAPRDIAARGMTARYRGSNSWGCDYQARGGHPLYDPTPIYAHFENECRRAMQVRHASPSALYREPDELHLAFRPAISFYEDSVIFGVGSLEQYSQPVVLVAGLLRNFLHDLELLRLLGLADASGSAALEQTMWMRLTKPGASDDWLADFARPRLDGGEKEQALRQFFFGQRFLKLP